MLDRAAHAEKTVNGNYLKCFAYYDNELRKKDDDERFVINSMESAIVNREFEVFLQPKVRISTGKIVGSESLIRWRHPERGLIYPGSFIPAFERNGFIMKLDCYVWEETCKIIRRWLDEGKKVQPVSVNLSRVDLYNPKLVENILQIVNKYGVPHRLFEVELTESAFISDMTQFTNLISNISALDFSILLDDFGSGYSSLNILKDIEVDVLKLDMKFLSKNVETQRGSNILKHIINMAKSIDLPVIVEGVENRKQADLLVRLGCEYAQGYLFGKPVPVPDFEQSFMR